MVDRVFLHDPGAYLDGVPGAGLTPAATVAPGTVNGAGLLRQDANGRLLSAAAVSIATGASAATAVSVSVQLQEADDAAGTGGWADYGDPVILTSAASRLTSSVDLHGAKPGIRVQRVVALTGAANIQVDVSLALVKEVDR